MAGTQFFNLSRSSLAKPSRPLLYNPIKACQNYGQGSKGRLMEERAPSTAEEFERVAEEKKAKEAKKGVASQSLGKAIDGAEEAVIGKQNVESVKNRYKGGE
ncbi:uncharacterized protein LOC124838083 isoform X1 [Vigna umbellata]|uniref:uncharacterized protein LOC124838083 isoform X1 n=1 Tax=Vigna umbellata TaxID=87088 RepID=UPI001F5FE1AC|nr:uncharacterized protein LOC124838083 isoform X1 [Vigna umbellata]